jgi:hypothetical protein
VRELESSETTRQLLEGLDYPISKADVLRAAGEAQLPDAIVRQLATVPDRDYENAEELTRALNAV